MKLTSLQFGFGFSLLVHALVFGAIIWRGNIVHTPELSREDSLIWLTLMAAPLDGITPPENRIPKAVAIPASVPASIPVETLKPTLPPEAVVKSLELEPKPAPTTPAKPVAVVSPARPATPVTGDGSSPEPGLDATTQKAQVGVRAEPDYLKNPEPPYPMAARRRHETGTVLLAVKVTAQGRAAEVTVKQSSGYPLLDDSALNAVREWEFVPAHIGSLAVECQIEVPIRFKLE